MLDSKKKLCKFIFIILIIKFQSIILFGANLEWEAINAIKLNDGQEIHTLEDVERVEVNINIENPGIFVFLNSISNDHFSLSDAISKINEFKNKIVLDTSEYGSISDWYIKNCKIIRTHRNSEGRVVSEPIKHLLGTLVWYVPMHKSPSSIILGVMLEFHGSRLGYIENVPLPMPHYTCDCGERSCTDCGPEYDPKTNSTEYKHFRDSRNHCYSIINSIKNARIPLNNWSNPGIPPIGPTLKITYHDRTPPRIITSLPSVTGKFPRLVGTDDVATASTGDFYKPSLLRVVDNSGGKIYTAFAIKREILDINTMTNNATWTIVGNINECENDASLASHVIIPNDVYGEMNYAVFAYDTEGNLNPGEPDICEDKPENCYGLDARDSLYQDLGKVHGSSYDFPYKLHSNDPDEILNKIYNVLNQRINLIDEKSGYIEVEDNDRPNVMIKVQSTKDPTDVIIFPIPSLRNPNGFGETYQREYYEFIENSKLFVENIVSTSSSYFEIMQIDYSRSSGESPLLEGINTHFANIYNIFYKPSSIDILLKNFRLENYLKSDTNVDGEIITDELDKIGERYGIGRKAVVKSNIPLIEDVEYLVSFWADDNVHFVKTSGTIQNSYNGIKDSIVEISVPNQYPPINIKANFKPNSRIIGPYKIICREPIMDEISLNSTNHPRIYVKVIDLRGNIRELEVYFKVTDEKTRIRILEQSNQRKK